MFLVCHSTRVGTQNPIFGFWRITDSKVRVYTIIPYPYKSVPGSQEIEPHYLVPAFLFPYRTLKPPLLVPTTTPHVAVDRSS